MAWQSRVLSDLVAGVEIALVGCDLDSAERQELLRAKVLRRSGVPESGSVLRMMVDGNPEWRVFVPMGEGYLAHAEGPLAKALTLDATEATIYQLARERLYHSVATDLSCRPEVREVAKGVWLVGVFPLGDGTRARIFVAEPGTRDAELVNAIRSLPFKCVFVLGIGATDRLHQCLDDVSDKTIHIGTLEASAEGFFSNSLSEVVDLVASEVKGAFVDRSVSPPELVVNGSRTKLPMNAELPTDGVLYLEYLLDHPGEVFSAWELEGAVFPDRQGIQLGVDDRQTDVSEANLKMRAMELREDLADPHLSTETAEKFREELEKIQEEILKARSPSGRKKQLGESDTQRATGRVRKALKLVVDRVRKQNYNLGEALGEAIESGKDVQFRLHADWGL